MLSLPPVIPHDVLHPPSSIYYQNISHLSRTSGRTSITALSQIQMNFHILAMTVPMRNTTTMATAVAQIFRSPHIDPR